jgi:hypothetical protein
MTILAFPSARASACVRTAPHQDGVEIIIFTKPRRKATLGVQRDLKRVEATVIPPPRIA